jgi:translation initiation factor IF-3
VRSIRSQKETKEQVSYNEKIRAREVRLIDEDGKQLGIVPTFEALKLARERELDLVEISPTATPPVCKIMDYGQFKYQLAKKAHEAKKKQTVVQVKEIKLGLKIEEHDLGVKVRHIREFLTDGDKVKITIMFRGREILHKAMGENLALKVIEELKGMGTLEQKPKFEGRNIIMIFAPL